MTALAISYVTAGFCMAADGQVTHTNGKPIVTDDCSQKIFETTSDDFSLAYIMTGEVLSDDESYDLESEVKELTSRLATEHVSSFRDYRYAFEPLASKMTSLKKSGKISPYPNPNASIEYHERARVLAEMFLVGYFNGFPVWATFSFIHEEDGIVLEVYNQILHAGSKIYACGSDVVPRLAIDGDARLAKYRHHLSQTIKKESSLEDAANYVTAYVQVCCDPCAKEIDPDWCRLIGGHVHVAEVTPAGFRWRIPPEENNATNPKIFS